MGDTLLRRISLLCFTFVCSLHAVFGCMASTGPVGPTPGSIGPIQKCMGAQMTNSDYDSSAYDGKSGGPVTMPGDLDCTFDASCCYHNEQPPNDQLQWATIGGTADPTLLQQNFGTSTAPSLPSLATAIGAATDPNDQSQLSSCFIPCSTQPITVSLKYWLTKGVVLQVCTKDSTSASSKPTNCQTVSGPNPGPATVTLPAGSNIQVVVLAKGFTNVGSSGCAVAAVDDLKVSYGLCSGGECAAVACDFEQGNACAYTQVASSSSSTTPAFKVQNSKIGNRDTGVPGPGQGSNYLGVEVGPSQQSAIQSGTINNSQARKVQLMYFEATDQCAISACLNDLNSCTKISGSSVKVSDLQWQQAQFDLPAQTQKLYFLAKNSGQNLCAAGLDSITVLDSNGNNICTGGSSGSSSGGSGSGSNSSELFRFRAMFRA